MWKKIWEWILSIFKKKDNEPAEFPEGLIWLHHNVSGWAKTATLNVQQNGGIINMPYDKAKVWTTKKVNGTDVNANPWIIVKYTDGKHYAATWEYMRPGQTQKNMSGKSWGGHIDRTPLTKWEPKKGEQYGIFMSGLARTSTRNQQERSNVVWFTWK